MHRVSSVLCLLAVAVLPSTAAAKMTKRFTYNYNIVWSTAVRLIRADRGYRITDKDQSNGYILFLYPGSGSEKECSASLEIVTTIDEHNYEVVQAQLVIAQQPSYVELEFLEALERKLRDEQGDPPPARHPPKQEKPKTPPKPKAPPSGEKDGAEGSG